MTSADILSIHHANRERIQRANDRLSNPEKFKALGIGHTRRKSLLRFLMFWR